MRINEYLIEGAGGNAGIAGSEYYFAIQPDSTPDREGIDSIVEALLPYSSKLHDVWGVSSLPSGTEESLALLYMNRSSPETAVSDRIWLRRNGAHLVRSHGTKGRVDRFDVLEFLFYQLVPTLFFGIGIASVGFFFAGILSGQFIVAGAAFAVALISLTTGAAGAWMYRARKARH